MERTILPVVGGKSHATGRFCLVKCAASRRSRFRFPGLVQWNAWPFFWNVPEDLSETVRKPRAIPTPCASREIKAQAVVWRQGFPDRHSPVPLPLIQRQTDIMLHTTTSRRAALAAAVLLVLTVTSVTARAEHEGKTQILLLGDSTTEGSIPRKIKPDGPHLERVLELLLAAEGDLPACHAINSGVSGEYIRRLIDSGRYARDVEQLPGLDWIFVRYGINDRSRIKNFDEQFETDFHELIALLRKDHPEAKIVLMTVIPFANPEVSEQINEHVRNVAEKEQLPLFDIYPRYAAELEKGYNVLNYRRYPLARVPEKYHPLVKPFVSGDSVLVMSNELDAILGHLPGWTGDRHPNLAGYNVIADETAKWLAPHLRKKE